MRRRREPAPRGDRHPIGVILAGGDGTRIGGSKAIVNLRGRPLISYPLEAMWRAMGSVAIVAKIDTQLPSVAGVTVWIEPDEPRHPLAGIVHALWLADGRPVVVCPVDLPFVTAGLIRRVAQTEWGHAGAVIASLGGRTQPLLGCYQPEALAPLTSRLERSEVPVREAVAALDPVLFEVEDADELFNINSPDDLLQASAMLGRREPSRSR
ncbi:MAG TPA: molybdenum cofactor guanylyltransferase [Solirubrobacteraceae bacterium]|jgi:molybdopterin-guanine dinucleotide biosynthesis protein A